MNRLSITLPLLVALSILPAVSEERTDPGPETGPIWSDLVEETGVELMLLDVVVADKNGKPVRSLDLEDFSLTLDGRNWPLYSVDDMCSCREEEEQDPSGTIATTPAPVPAEIPAEPHTYILYIDFSVLRLDGRANALKEATRWVNETRQPGDSVQLVAYSSLPGLVELTPVTTDPGVLLAALKDVENDPEFIDPFPSLVEKRADECERCYARCQRDCNTCENICNRHARDEYFHGRRSLRSVQRYLRRLDRIPGRKSVLYFHENGFLFPARFYVGVDETRIGDHLNELDMVGAEATTARATVHSLYTGDQQNLVSGFANQAVNFGANLADFTGGTFNRRVEDLPANAASAGRGCTCLYRLAFRPPHDEGTGKTHRAVVFAAGRRVPHSYRVQHLTGLDRWLRKAQELLQDPERATDLPLGVGIIPVGRDKAGWTFSLRVAVDLDSLVIVPRGREAAGAWEVGALFHRTGGNRATEMLARSQVRRESTEPTGAWILHERTISGVKPGEYRLAAFLRDQAGNSFGGGETSITLPEKKKGGVIGPVMVQQSDSVMRTTLPILENRERPSESTGKLDSDLVPLDAGSVVGGSAVRFLSLACPARESAGGRAVRWVSSGNRPLFRFEQEEIRQDSDDCLHIEDEIETGFLPSGEHIYHMVWIAEDSADMIITQVPFNVE